MCNDIYAKKYKNASYTQSNRNVVTNFHRYYIYFTNIHSIFGKNTKDYLVDDYVT